jgi:hypothetical protein
MPPSPEPEAARAPEPAAVIEPVAVEQQKSAPWSPPEPVVVEQPTAAPWSQPEPEPVELIVDAAVADAPAFEEPLASIEFGESRRRARWPMLVGAVAVVAGVGFMVMRPRSSVEPLAPQRVETARAAARSAAVTPAAQARPGTTADADASGRAPAYVVELPDAPPPEATPPADASEPVVPAAPKVSRMAPISDIAPGLEVDAAAEQRQRSLEATRRQIDQQLRQQQP